MDEALYALRRELTDPDGLFGARSRGGAADLIIDVTQRAALRDAVERHGLTLHPTSRYHAIITGRPGAFEVYSREIPARDVALALARGMLSLDETLVRGRMPYNWPFPAADGPRTLAEVEGREMTHDQAEALRTAVNAASFKSVLGPGDEYGTSPAPDSGLHEALTTLLVPCIGGDVPFGDAGRRIHNAIRECVRNAGLVDTARGLEGLAFRYEDRVKELPAQVEERYAHLPRRFSTLRAAPRGDAPGMAP